ncbi:uncharacterized protein LOC141627394 [Silene latifolia]|uniref:uncharacterized protein LOC141627394 n=1 Tax=Silene latifolia TaxID=37657 RepID=UPI003D7754CD
MFQTNNHEPSSPKVTCIGQVRGKSRKHGEKMKMLACRSHPPRNQKWVHLPLTICDTLKEFSCLIPCKSSCFSNSNNVEGDNKGGSGSSSCGGVFRWMVSLHDGEGGGRRDVELVVNGDEDELMERSCSRRRSIFDDMEFDDLFNNVGIRSNHSDNDNDNGNDGGSRVSICVPPKNALLLMRCRSDPMRMASLSQKLWDPPLVQQHHHDEEVIQDVVIIKGEDNHVEFERLEEMVEITENSVNLEDLVDEIIEPIVEDLLVCSDKSEEKLEEEEEDENSEKTEENSEELEENKEIVEEEGNLLIVDETQLVEGLNLVDECSIETITAEDKVEECGNDQQDLVNKEEDEEEIEMQEKSEKEESCVLSTDSSTFGTSLLDSTVESTELESKVEEKEQQKVIVQGEARKPIDMEKNKPMLPDCLLLMMCEPKLSMEVSKETWVCGTDFIRWLPERHQGKKGNKVEGGDDQSSNNSNKKTKASAVAALPPLPPSAQCGRSGIQPGRSSISFPASGGSVANLIEQKLAKAGVGFEPFVLTRCKSAPMRSMAKFEPHRPATCGVGAARVGF